MKRLPFLFLLLVFLVTSCKKEDLKFPFTYGSEYHRTRIDPVGEFRVFSANGEITSKSVVNRYIQSDTAYFSYLINNLNSGGSMESIKFSDAGHAVVNDWSTPVNCLLAIENGKLILTRRDITTAHSAPDEFTHTLFYQIGEVKPEVFTEYLVSSTAGAYLFGYSAREKYVLKEHASKLVAPWIVFLKDRNGFYSGYVNNVLQKDFYKHLADGDTLALQEYLMFYEKY